MKIYRAMLKSAGIVIEKLYFHTNMNLLVSHVVTMETNANMYSLRYKEKKYFLSTD